MAAPVFKPFSIVVSLLTHVQIVLASQQEVQPQHQVLQRRLHRHHRLQSQQKVLRLRQLVQ